MKINMKKIKLIFIQILLFSLITISNSFGKALPPGSGVADVPANVLILLDKSGSMGASSYSGARVNRTYQITAISNTGNVIVTDGSTLRGVDHNNNTLTNFYSSRNNYRTRNRHVCSTYYKSQYGLLYHSNKVYFLGAYYSRDNDLYELNTSTGACKKIESFGRTQTYGRMLVSNNILIFPNYQNKLFLYDTNTGQKNHCSLNADLYRSVTLGKYNNRIPATIDASGNLVIKSYEGGKLYLENLHLEALLLVQLVKQMQHTRLIMTMT